MASLLEHPAPEASTDEILAIAAEHFGLAGDVIRLDSERDLNALVVSDEGQFLFKIANAAESFEASDMQAAALEHIAGADPTLNIPRVRRSRRNFRVEVVKLAGIDHATRVTSFLDGTTDWEGETSPRLSAAIGTMLARLQHALRGFFHPAGGRALLWDVRSAGKLVDWVDAIADPAVRRAVMRIFRRSVDEVLPALAYLPAQPIHNDFHRGNLLIDQEGRTVTGIIDFGDLIHATRSQDVAVACAYAMLETSDPLAIIRSLISAFCSKAPLLDEEIEVIGDLMGVRLAQSLAIGSWRAVRHPANVEYIQGDAAAVTAGLEQWLDLGHERIRDAVGSAAGAPHAPDISGRLRERRARVLAPGLRLSYQEPLHLVRGDGVWLFDANDRRYLDAYNNVVQVGHASRSVAGAVVRQMTRLNTNTRYLTDAIVDYGERLTAQLPDRLEVCYFVNSGTEANDLAWRIAKTVTGGSGAIVTEDAYHGWSDAVMAMSPEELKDDELAPWLATVPPPGSRDAGLQVAEAIAQLRGNGHAPAAIFIDATFSSDGIFDLTPGYLSDTAGAVQEEGGLFVADEVQAGLGRVGNRFWGFAADQVVPDIVTLGKPLGNGYPIGVAVTTRSVAEAFEGYFFSTFGGNPVAAAAAAMVLKITLEDDLAGRAERIGQVLRDGLTDALESRKIGAMVRGPGTFIGVDLGSRELAAALVEAMRHRGVLIGRTGPNDDVLKIRPPLIFEEEHAEVLLEAFSEATDAV